jgi:hypothetical protein
MGSEEAKMDYYGGLPVKFSEDRVYGAKAPSKISAVRCMHCSERFILVCSPQLEGKPFICPFCGAATRCTPLKRWSRRRGLGSIKTAYELFWG